MDAKVPSTIEATPPKPQPKAPTQVIVSPMTTKDEVIFAAELCGFLREQSSFVENVTRNLHSVGATSETVRIQLLDGTKNGSPTQAAVIRFRHASHTDREHIFVVVRGSGVALREKWLMENDCEPTNMVQTRGLAKTYVAGKYSGVIQIHKGVLRGYRSVESELRKIVQTCPAKSNLVITGYGFGGAIANVAALDLVNRNRSDPYHADIAIRLVTFNAPQYFANKVFHHSLRSLLENHSAYARALDPVSRMVSMNKSYSLPIYMTTWVHEDTNPRSVHPTRETRSVAPPAGAVTGFWPVCCGCGPQDNPEDHSIGKILGHLRIV
jgi:hypothetical protein